MATRQERARSFGAIAAEYDRLRAGPPDEAVDWLLPRHCEVAVDVGAGTGLLARALAQKVGQVIAVEPDERMRAVLAARSPGIRVLAGKGEAIPLPDASADAVFASSAWHWMDPDQAVPEVARILRDGGRFGVIWTSRDRRVDWVRELGQLTVPAPARTDASAPDGTAGDGAARPPERSHHHEVILPETGLFENVMTESFTFTRTMTKDAMVELLATYSGVITASPQDRAAGLARARAALDEWFPADDEIEVPMWARAWRADRVARR
ncbi:MAG: class I SAM-dependent methyltransferase [Streptosporangiaceae bacterium]